MYRTRPIFIHVIVLLLLLSSLFVSPQVARAASSLSTESPAAEVGGPIMADTTWTAANSPYVLTGDVTIADNASLTIEPGVTVQGNGYTVEVFGTLSAVGTAANQIVLDDVTIRGGNNSHVAPPYQIEIQHAQITDSALSSPGYGSLNLRDSQISGLKPPLYLWYPVADVHIERNVFHDSGGISAGTSDGVRVYIRNNVFEEQRSQYDQFAIEVWASYDTSRTIVEHNSFLSTDRIALRLPPGYGDVKLAATNNYWGTTDSATIEQMIFDRNDDPAVDNAIAFEPFLDAPHPDTPEPVIPDIPDDPSDPQDPGDPTDPQEPSDPGDPQEPADPTDPQEPGDPTDPQNPQEDSNVFLPLLQR